MAEQNDTDTTLVQEIDAMRVIHGALAPLRGADRRRVMSWVTDRLSTDDERRARLLKESATQEETL